MQNQNSPTALSDILLSEQNFESVVQDCIDLIHAEVKQRNLAVRGIFNLAVRAKPRLVERGVELLLPEFARALDPHYAAFTSSSYESFVTYSREQRAQMADALLGITDARIEKVNSKAVRGAYGKLRGLAAEQVQKAMPGVAGVIAHYVPTHQAPSDPH